MATVFFPLSATAPATSTFTTALTRQMTLIRGAAAVSQADATVVSLVTAANPQGTGAVSPAAKAVSTTLAAAGTVESGATIGASLFWVSPPLRAVTISGTVTANLRSFESAVAANYAIGCKLYRLSTLYAVTTAFAQGSNVTEIGIAEAATSIALTPTSTAIAEGERLGLLIFFCSPSGSTSAAGRTATLVYNGPTGAASGDTFLSFTETINPVGLTKQGFAAEQAVARLATW